MWKLPKSKLLLNLSWTLLFCTFSKLIGSVLNFLSFFLLHFIFLNLAFFFQSLINIVWIYTGKERSMCSYIWHIPHQALLISCTTLENTLFIIQICRTPIIFFLKLQQINATWYLFPCKKFLVYRTLFLYEYLCCYLFI